MFLYLWTFIHKMDASFVCLRQSHRTMWPRWYRHCRLPDKQCSSDPLPTWLLKVNAEILVPFLSHLFSCWSLENGVVSMCMKTACITAAEKGDIEKNGSLVLSYCLKFFRVVQGPRTACFWATRDISKGQPVSSKLAVGVQKVPFYWDCRTQSPVWHPAIPGFRQLGWSKLLSAAFDIVTRCCDGWKYHTVMAELSLAGLHHTNKGTSPS